MPKTTCPANRTHVNAVPHSMHRRALAPLGGPRHTVALIAQLTEQVHDRCLGRIHEGPAGDVLGVLQKLFGFGEFFHAASVRGPSCMCMHSFLNKVERK